MVELKIFYWYIQFNFALQYALQEINPKSNIRKHTHTHTQTVDSIQFEWLAFSIIWVSMWKMEATDIALEYSLNLVIIRFIINFSIFFCCPFHRHSFDWRLGTIWAQRSVWTTMFYCLCQSNSHYIHNIHLLTEFHYRIQYWFF